MRHKLKIKGMYYLAIREGRKTHEVRFNDRDYQTGDTIIFLDIDHSGFPELPGEWQITHILHYTEGLKDGWVVLSLKGIDYLR